MYRATVREGKGTGGGGRGRVNQTEGKLHKRIPELRTGQVNSVKVRREKSVDDEIVQFSSLSKIKCRNCDKEAKWLS